MQIFSGAARSLGGSRGCRIFILELNSSHPCKFNWTAQPWLWCNLKFSFSRELPAPQGLSLLLLFLATGRRSSLILVSSVFHSVLWLRSTALCSSVNVCKTKLLRREHEVLQCANGKRVFLLFVVAWSRMAGCLLSFCFFFWRTWYLYLLCRTWTYDTSQRGRVKLMSGLENLVLHWA